MLQIGFDIGGSNIAVGVVDDAQNIIARRSIKFPTGEPYAGTVKRMAALVNELADELNVESNSFQSIGMAVPGSLDRQSKTVLYAYNLQFHNVPLCSMMQEYFPDVQMYLANDANAAALAELYSGAFKGCQTAVLITLGTGIGGGLILNGRMYNGGRNSGVELGHMILAHNGSLCTCGNNGCIETLCTATWLVQCGRKCIVEYPKTLIYTKAGGDMDKVSAKLVINCAMEGDKIALHIFHEYVDQLGSAIAGIINLLDPEVIALGGGVSLTGDFLFDPLRENVKQKVFFKTFGELVPAQLGNDAGIIGASLLWRNGQ